MALNGQLAHVEIDRGFPPFPLHRKSCLDDGLTIPLCSCMLWCRVIRPHSTDAMQQFALWAHNCDVIIIFLIHLWIWLLLRKCILDELQTRGEEEYYKIPSSIPFSPSSQGHGPVGLFPTKLMRFPVHLLCWANDCCDWKLKILKPSLVVILNRLQNTNIGNWKDLNVEKVTQKWKIPQTDNGSVVYCGRITTDGWTTKNGQEEDQKKWRERPYILFLAWLCGKISHSRSMNLCMIAIANM